MPIEFYAAEARPVLGPVTMLPQKGSVSGGTNRPMNSYAIRVDGPDGPRSILFDAPFSWTLDGARQVHDMAPVAAQVLSHRDIAASGDAFDAHRAAFGAPFLMHAADQTEDAPAKLDVPLEDVTGHPALLGAGLEVIHMPGHSPGSVMLYRPDDGILLAGDCAVAPGPEQEAQPPRLQRPKMEDADEAAFVAAFAGLIDRLPPLRAVLPLHGAWYLRQELGDDAFDEAVRTIWDGAAMDPSGV